MDETQSSRVSDAAATRKRRSSILKSQRAPRTPFSELEFNVATPTDPGKSRRVSFSRRMGVAEFVTNEATTTWKNFYEEHNKSLESSGNESAANGARPSISHIGKRIFDQQFEEVEAVDFESALLPANSRVPNFSISINNINLTQQLAAFDCSVDDKKLNPPQQHLELSSLTEHKSKVFSDDLTLPVMGEMSNQINVNFSVMNPIGNSNDKCDDLDEIQKDLERSHNVICPGPFREGHMSEYIEVDLNMTHVAIRNDESDMSITDTIHSPKVQEVSSSKSVNKSRKSLGDLDWTTDKENIAVLNPYVAPKESDNFAINEILDQVLVFDGKKLIVQTEINEIPVEDREFKSNEGTYRQTLLPVAPLEKTPQRKTVVLNINDDLPNFIENPILPHHEDPDSATAQDVKRDMIFNEGELSMTDALPNVVQLCDIGNLSRNKKVIECENMTTGNISMTRAVSTNVIIQHNVPSEKRKTILYDDGNISMTQALPVNILLDRKSEVQNKRRATVYDENISFTQAIPANLIMSESKENTSNKTILFQNNIDDISFTQGLPNNLYLEKNNGTKIFEKSVSNISMTQILPSNIVVFDNEPVSDKRKTIIYESDDGNISVTQAIPNQIIAGKAHFDAETANKRKTIVFENETGNVSLTQVLPAKIIQQEVFKKSALGIGPNKITVKSPVKDQENKENVTAPETSINISKNVSVCRKRLTVMYDEHAEISMTETLPANILSTNLQPQPDQTKSVNENEPRLSGTQLLSSNISFKAECDERVTSQFIHKNHDIMSMTQVVSDGSNLALVDNDKSNIVHKSLTDVKYNISANIIQGLELKETTEVIGNVAMTKPIPTEICKIENETLKSNEEKFSNLTRFSEQTLLQDTIHNKTNVEILVYQSKTYDNVEMQQTNETDHGDLLDEATKSSFNIKNTDSTSNKSVKSTSDNNGLINDKDTELQVDQLNDELSKKSDSVSGYDGVIETIDSKVLPGAKENKTILHELLDMSSCSIVDEVVDKNVMVQLDTEMVAEKSQKGSGSNSDEVIFVVTQDSKENITENENKNKVPFVKVSSADNLDKIDKSQLLALQFNSDEEYKCEEKNIELRSSLLHEEKKTLLHNRHFEKIVSPDLLTTKQEDKSNVQDLKMRKSFKEADDTKELLEILSDFTDRKSYPPAKEDCNKEESKIKLRSSMALEHKTDIPDPRRLSFAPKRQSIVLSREDLLNNLLMAQAVLQQTHFEDSDIEDTATESPPEINESLNAPKKSVRMSNEVVKTLHFEDESCSDASLKSEVKISPLKKTAFGETSYMKESKVNVIPTYLKDVSDNIKALMNDLVKPRPEQIPFEVSIPRAKKQTSTCSTEIQANLVTSSQIDLDVDLQSNVNSVYELNKSDAMVTDVADIGNKAITSALKEHVHSVGNASDMDVGNEPNAVKYHKVRSTIKHHQEPILVFDHRNPLNNVLLAPPNCVDVHKYDPIKSSEKLRVEGNCNNSKNVDETKRGNKCEEERVITQYNVHSHVGLQSGDASSDKKGESHMLCSDPSKPLSMDRSTEGFATELKSTEVNTVIVMKGNKELLEASSSLTLVDDALMQSVFDVKVETQKTDEQSPVKVIYKIDDEDVSMLENIDSDMVSNDDEPVEYTKAKKRSYSPTRRDMTKPTTVSSPDVTPKPISKMQKISNSPNVYNTHANISHASTIRSEKIDSNCETEYHKKRSPRKSKGSPKYLKPGTDLTVQRLITEYKITKMEQDLIEDQIIEAIQERMSSCGTGIEVHKTAPHSPEVVSSCTSSKDQNEMEDPCVKETVSYVGSQPSRVDWQPELKELSSRNILIECESSVNVVAKIDMLPFMGRSRECEWEACAGDTWVFRLLRARLRLRVRLAHRLHNAPRSRVRADTPVEEITVDAMPVEERDPLAALCVRFACEAMRYECARGCARAGDVPPALRRCAGVARVALRWARAMRDARARLAYTLHPDGLLTLKVANVSLRSVWEVSVRLELVVGDAREAAWPRAGEPRLRAVLGARAPPALLARPLAALARLPRDWGHAPRTLWKIFRYLKNMTRHDDFLELTGEQIQEAC